MNAFETEDRFLLPTYKKFPFALVRGEGNWVVDHRGERYLDLYGGHAVSLLGHSHPRWVEAITRQLRRLDFYSNVCYHPERAAAAELLVRHSYPSMHGVFFCNSGAEANEAALKLVRKATGRSRVVAMKKGFHGRTAAALSVSDTPRLHEMFPENLCSWTDFVELGDLGALERLPAREIAAVILEPIESLSGVYMAAPEYYPALREYCSRHEIRLVFDEVQTGSGRTGRWYAGEHWGVEPDVVTTAKGVGGGFPVGVVIANGAIASDVKAGDHGSTFGGGPLAAAAVAATYRILEEENLVETVARRGACVRDRLEGMVGAGLVREVRGLGYLLGVELEVPATRLQEHLREQHVLVGTSGQANTVRLLPPLTVTEEEWDLFFAALATFQLP